MSGDRPAEADLLVDAVIETLRARRENTMRGPWPYETLADRWPAEVVLGCMERLDDAGIIECGVSLRTAWVRDYLPDIGERIAAFKAGTGG